MKTVKDILRGKGSNVTTINQKQMVYEALKQLADADIGALVVVDDQGAVVGILSEREYARKVILKGMSSLNTPVQEIMTRQVCYVHPDQTVDECMALVTEKHRPHLPVLENGVLLGIVSIGDLVKASISEKEFLIDQLTHYIGSG
ncbi:MAG: CBS domain-containing protein [Desulfuromusa sp.]|nr:CBS domain-containing protein [Desulfuromusa sp.]